MFDIKVEKLSKGLDFLSIDYDHNLINKFILYYEFLNKENKKYNLTSITDFDDFISCFGFIVRVTPNTKIQYKSSEYFRYWFWQWISRSSF